MRNPFACLAAFVVVGGVFEGMAPNTPSGWR